MSIILHHYPFSPYSEKIRAMFGFTNIEWASCIASEAPPRGKLDLLAGGYGRIPIGQLGSDIFCDTNIIADEIANMTNKPALSDRSLDQAALKQRQWLETTLFFACVNRAFSLSLIKRIAKDKGLLNLVHFLKDRIEMGMKASISMGSPKSAPKHIHQALNDLAKGLAYKDFVGGDGPNIIDFAAYHCFWFLHEVGQKKDLNKHQKVLTWYHRMNTFSSMPTQEISIEDALNEAKISQPRPLDKRYLQDHRIGSKIVISPSDYRKVPVSGVLAGVDEQRWIILREQSETGPVHLHFPTKAVDVTIRIGK